MERPSRRSIRVAVAETGPEGQEEDLQVEAEAPALDVVEVVFDPFLDRGLASPAVDLRPARDARLHLVAEHVAGHPPAELLDEARALGPRADEARARIRGAQRTSAAPPTMRSSTRFATGFQP